MTTSFAGYPTEKGVFSDFNQLTSVPSKAIPTTTNQTVVSGSSLQYLPSHYETTLDMDFLDDSNFRISKSPTPDYSNSLQLSNMHINRQTPPQDVCYLMIQNSDTSKVSIEGSINDRQQLMESISNVTNSTRQEGTQLIGTALDATNDTTNLMELDDVQSNDMDLNMSNVSLKDLNNGSQEITDSIPDHSNVMDLDDTQPNDVDALSQSDPPKLIEPITALTSTTTNEPENNLQPIKIVIGNVLVRKTLTDTSRSEYTSYSAKFEASLVQQSKKWKGKLPQLTSGRNVMMTATAQRRMLAQQKAGQPTNTESDNTVPYPRIKPPFLGHSDGINNDNNLEQTQNKQPPLKGIY